MTPNLIICRNLVRNKCLLNIYMYGANRHALNREPSDQQKRNQNYGTWNHVKIQKWQKLKKIYRFGLHNCQIPPRFSEQKTRATKGFSTGVG